MNRIIILIALLISLCGCNKKIEVDNSFVYLQDPTCSSTYNSYIKQIVDGNESISFVETTDIDDYTKKINELSNKSTQLLISTDLLVEIAKVKTTSFKNQDIVSISNSIKTKYLDENIMQVLYKTNNAGFLLGTIGGHYAARTAQRQVGFVVTDECDACSRFLAGVEDGFWEEFPEGNIVIAKTSLGLTEEECVDRLVEEGINLIFTSVEHQNTGVLAQAIKYNTEGIAVNVVLYDRCPRNIGNYTYETKDKNGEVESTQVKNCILCRAYDSAKPYLDFIVRKYNAGLFENGIITPYEAGFDVEIMNEASDLNKEVFNELLNKYVLALNSNQIIVRTTPSNPNIESRVRIID